MVKQSDNPASQNGNGINPFDIELIGDGTTMALFEPPNPNDPFGGVGPAPQIPPKLHGEVAKGVSRFPVGYEMEYPTMEPTSWNIPFTDKKLWMTPDMDQPVDPGDCARWPNSPYCGKFIDPLRLTRQNYIGPWVGVTLTPQGPVIQTYVNFGPWGLPPLSFAFWDQDYVIPDPPDPPPPASPDPYLPEIPPPQSWFFDVGDCTRSVVFVYVHITTRIWSEATKGEIEAIPTSREGSRQRLDLALSKAVGSVESRVRRHENRQFWYNPDAAPVNIAEVGNGDSIISYNPDGTVSTVGKTTLVIPQEDGSILYQKMGPGERVAVGSGRSGGSIRFPNHPIQFDPGYEGLQVYVLYTTRIIEKVYACPVTSTELGAFYRFPEGPEIYSHLSGTGTANGWPGPTIRCSSATCNAPSPPPPPPPPPSPSPEDDMGCCQQSLQVLKALYKQNKEILEKNGEIHQRYVADNWGEEGEGIEVPEQLFGTEEKQVTVYSWPQWFLWFVSQFDALIGQWPIEIEIEQEQPQSDGRVGTGEVRYDPIKIEIANLAEAMAELYGLGSSAAMDSDVSVAILTRLALETVGLKVMGVSTSDYVRSIADFLGYPGKEVERNVNVTFSLSKAGKDDSFVEVSNIQEMLSPSTVQARGYQFVDQGAGSTAVEAFQTLLQAAQIIKAVHLRTEDRDFVGPPNPDGSRPGDLLSRLRDIADIVDTGLNALQLFDKDGNPISLDWEQFLKDLEDPNSLLNRGFPTPDVITSSNPNGSTSAS